jgi:hypothetical protein
VIRPHRRTVLEATPEGGRRPRAAAGFCLSCALGLLAVGCQEAATQPNVLRPTTPGPPQVVVSPSADTTVDSIGTLTIVVAVHDQAPIDSVAVIFQGAPLSIPTTAPHDTTFLALYPIALGPLHHQAFSFAVYAADILGYDTTTASVTVRLR